MTDLLKLTPAGLYCPQGDFYIDPSRKVHRAIVTHAHSDHARKGCDKYLALEESTHVLHSRLGNQINLVSMQAGRQLVRNGITISLHHAGHILGSAQVRLERAGEVVVVSGDYKLQADNTCAPFEQLKCHSFITESTFGLPIYQWASPMEIFEQINRWWRSNNSKGLNSIMYAYSLGKSQRIIAGVDATIGPIYTHQYVEVLNIAYRKTGIVLPSTRLLNEGERPQGALIVAPPGTDAEWMNWVNPYTTATASGWLRLRNKQRSGSQQQSFVLSDHADWPGLLQAIEQTEAETVLITHGPSPALVRWLRDRGRDAQLLAHALAGEMHE